MLEILENLCVKTVVSVYADDPGAPETSPTKDVDIVIDVVSATDLEIFRQLFSLQQHTKIDIFSFFIAV